MPFLAAGGEMGKLMRDHDWSTSPLGDPSVWPQSLRAVVALMINSRYPMFVAWGPKLAFLYNDGYIPIFGRKHPHTLGLPFKQVWSEIWADISPLIERALAGEATFSENLHLVMERNGYPEDTWYSFSYSPVRDERGAVAGMFCACAETTQTVLGDRRREALLKLDESLRAVADTAGLSFAASEILGKVLGAVRVGYGAVDPAAGTITVERSWYAPGFNDVAGVHHFANYGSYIEDLRRGDAVANADVVADPRTAANADAFGALGIRAHLDVPVVEDGRTVGQIFVHSATPRAWTDEEVAFVQAFAERTRAAIARRVAETAHRASEARVKAIVDQATAGIAQTDLEGRFLTVNDRYCAIVGRTRDELLSMRMQDLTHPDDLKPNVLMFAAAAAGGAPFDIEKRYLRPDGGTVWVRNSVTGVRDAGGRVEAMLAVSIDLTDRRVAEAALRESEARFRNMADCAPVMMWVTDPSGHCTYLNASWYEFTGQAPSTGEGYGWLDAVHPEDRPAAEAAFVSANAERRNYRVDFRLRRADGTYRWTIDAAAARFDQAGAFLGFVGSVIDIEDRKEMEAALEQRVIERTAELSESQRRFQGIFHSALQFMALLEPDGTVIEVNETALAWSEIKPSDIVGKPFWQAAPMRENPELQAAVEEGIRRAAAGETVRTEHEMRGAGEIRAIVDFSLKPVPGEGGKAVWLVAEGRDVTDLKAAQEALRQSQKMEAMGQLTGGVAHDFNNLLTPIVGSLDMLQRKRLGNEREQRLIAGAMQSAERAKTLVQRLLAFARRQPLQVKPVDVARLVTGMGNLVASTTGPQIRVVVEAAEGLPAAVADSNQLEMAILNLAVNARDAMPNGGTLRISAVADSIRPGHRSQLRTGDYIRLSVADTGTGMDEATIARAVEPFFSTKGVGKGTGLGLSMVHGLASQLGGALTIQSRPGLGTNVELWLPRSTVGPNAAEEAHDIVAPATTRGTALLVDDEELVRMSTADMLSDLGYAVVEAVSGEEAMRLVETGEPFDLLVTDHLMPGISGTDLARVVRGARPGVPILLVSGYAEREGLDPDLPRLIKPFRKDELASSLAQLSGSP